MTQPDPDQPSPVIRLTQAFLGRWVKLNETTIGSREYAGSGCNEELYKQFWDGVRWIKL